MTQQHLVRKAPVLCGPSCNKPSANFKAGWSDQVKEFFVKLFDVNDWPPRWHCGTWTDFHGWLYIASDLMIATAYFAIPILLYRIVAKRRDLPFAPIFWLFITFILLCGSTHFFDALIFWWPAYRLSALIRLLTGAISVITVIALYKILPLIQKLRTLEQLEIEIEERKKAEQEARHQQFLQMTTRELMQKKDEFMSIASHELKTPITSAKASLQLVARFGASNPELKPIMPMIEMAAKQVNKMTGIINDLLDVTRIQGGKLPLNKSQFLLAELVQECVAPYRLSDQQHSIHLSGNERTQVFADRNRVEQVLSNLLTNAIKYSPKGGIINLHFETLPNGDVKTSIHDHGIGIPPEQIKNIFDRFFRVENTSQNFSGLGLGLYISSEIIREHGGSIGAESIQGKGSTFWFILPAFEPVKS